VFWQSLASLGDDDLTAPHRRPKPPLLEAMEERQVTADDGTHVASSGPFLVLAYAEPDRVRWARTRCPRPSFDRFLVRLRVGYPTADDEWAML